MSNVEKDQDLPNSRAAQMLRAGLARAATERGLSVRGAARELGYKASVVISHMQTGRVPIPLDRAPDIARVVGLPVPEFCVAVLEQRYSRVFPHIVCGLTAAHDQGIAGDLQLLAGAPLDSLSVEHQRVLREVVAERAPGRRWLSVSEIPPVTQLRKLRPKISEEGLDVVDMEAIASALH